MLQACIGFGLALVAAPLLVIVDRQFVPAPLILASFLLTLSMAYRERQSIDVDGLKVALLGRIGGTIPAALLAGALSAHAFDLLFGSIVLAAVGLSLLHREVRPTRTAVLVASVASGFMGTTSSIGGPPLALVYQSSQGARLRATLAALFLMGCVISLAALAAVGRCGQPELVRALVLTPGIPLGLVISRPLLPALDGSATRPLVLGLSSLSAVVILARAFASTS